MSLKTFLESLWSEGRVRVGPPESLAIEENDVQDTRETLQECDRLARASFPGTAPELSLRSAVWAAEIFRRASSFLIHRDASADEMKRSLADECPEAASPSVCYSVDLTFRFLPDLIRLARAVSANDPLLEVLMRWAVEWPLSSVGVDLPEAAAASLELAAIVRHSGLLALYADRIIERKDQSRLRHDQVRQAVDSAVGAHPELAPWLAPRE